MALHDRGAVLGRRRGEPLPVLLRAHDVELDPGRRVATRAGVPLELAPKEFAVLEALLTRFRPDSEISRIAAGALPVADADPAVRAVLQRCEALRRLTDDDFEYEPRRRTGRPDDPLLDVNALA
ncbi:MAG: hypothetical protein ABR585_15790, partial [Gemmatimonadaceae bacterium]